MPLDGASIHPRYTGGSLNSDGSLSLGGVPSSFGVNKFRSFLTSNMSSDRVFVDTTRIGDGANAHADTYCTFLMGPAALHATKVLAFDDATGAFLLAEPVPSLALSGDGYRINEKHELWQAVSLEDSAQGATHWRCVGIQQNTGGQLSEYSTHVRLLDSAGIGFRVASVNDAEPSPTNFTAISDEYETPDIVGDCNQFGGVGDVVRDAVFTPELVLPGEPGGRILRNPPAGDLRQANLAYIFLWLARDIPAGLPQIGEVAVQFVHRYEDTGGDPDPLFTSWVAFFDVGGYTPDVTIKRDRQLVVAGGVRFEVEVRTLETGVVVPGLDVDYALTDGPGTLHLRDPDDRVTDENGRSFVSYEAPDDEEFQVTDDFTATPGLMPNGYTLTRASAGYDGSYIDSAGDMQDAAAGAARWTYDPVTLAVRGLLNEPERTNLEENTQQPQDNAGGWFNTQAVITVGSGTILGRTVSRAQFAGAVSGNNVAAISVEVISGSTSGRTYVGSIWALNNGGATAVGSRIQSGGGAQPVEAANQTGNSLSASPQHFQQAYTIVENDRTNLVYFTLRADGSGTYDLHHGMAQVELIPSGEEQEASSWIDSGGVPGNVTRARDVLTRSGIPPGRYDITIARDGIADEVQTDVVINDGTFEVPTSVHPLRSVSFLPSSEGDSITVEARVI